MDTKTLLLFSVIVLIAMLPSNFKLPSGFISLIKDDLGKICLLALTFLIAYHYDLHLGIMMSVLIILLIIKYNRYFILAEGFDNHKNEEDFKDQESTEKDTDTETETEKDTLTEKDAEHITITSPPYDEDIKEEDTLDTLDKCQSGTKFISKQDKQVFNLIGKPIDACVKDPSMNEDTEVMNEIIDMDKSEVNNQLDEDPIKELDNDIEGFVGSKVREHFGCGCGNNSEKKIETFINVPKDSDVPLAKNSYCLDKWGYDQSGCRYDMKSEPTNDYPYGQPLSNCSTYNNNQINITGTIFYPISN